MSTRERILDAAIQLFNEAGTAAVSTNHIAEAAKISPGNLYYHFKNKEEIIRSIMERLFAGWDAAFAPPTDQPLTLDDAKGLIRANLEVMWEYRFVYRELIALLRRDPALHERYLKIRQRGFADFHQLFEMFAAAGVIRLLRPDEVQQIAEVCWLISEFWLPALEITGRPINPPNTQHGVDLMMQVLRPYLIGASDE